MSDELPRKSRAVRWVIWFSASVLLVECVARAALILFVQAPFLASTTGWEEESEFAIWKFAHHSQVYADPLLPPYAISYFNWLFYAAYGLLAKLLSSHLLLDWIWIPTVLRMVSCLLCIGTFVVGLWIVRFEGLCPSAWSLREVAVFLAATLLFSALPSWELLTVRPEAAALFLETLGFAMALQYLRRPSYRRLILIVLVLYGAWAMKQSNITAITALCIYFMFDRNWRALAVVVTLTWALYGVTLWWGGDLFRFALIKSQMNCPMQLRHLAEIARWAFSAAPWIPFAGLIGLWPCVLALRGETVVGSKRLLLVFYWVALVWGMMISMKDGADVNYYLVASVAASLWLLKFAADRSLSPWKLKLVSWGMAVALLAPSLAFIVHLRDRTARLEVLAQKNQDLLQLRSWLQDLPAPVYVDYGAGDLPWIQRHAPNFVIAYTYPSDRRAGYPYKYGGLAGLVKHRYFGTIVLASHKPNVVDGVLLEGYSQAKTNVHFKVFVRD